MDSIILRDTAMEAAKGAGGLLLSRLSEPRQVSQKGFRDWVTDVDVDSQRWITTFIRERFPEHGFLTEEQDETLPAGAAITWIIDPVDGTSNYSRQQPIFCVSIGVAVSQKVVAGAIFDPMRQEMFGVASGRGSTLNGRPIQVSQVQSLQEAIVGLDWSRKQTQRQQVLQIVQTILQEVHTVRALGSAALALAWLAAGRLDGYFHLSAQPWDLAAGALLIQEAGGQFSLLTGREWSWAGNPNGSLASNGRLHPTLLALFAPHL